MNIEEDYEEMKVHTQSDTEVLSDSDTNPLEKTIYDLKINDSEDDELDEQGYIKYKEGENKFLTVCRTIHRRVNQHYIEDLRKYMNSKGMKFTIAKLHDEYRKEILPMKNSNPVKQEVDCLLDYLGISYYDLTIPEGV